MSILSNTFVVMRKMERQQRALLMVGSIDDHVPQRHPIRPLKTLADRALASMNETFEGMYAQMGRPSVPPERLLKA
jgi:transposase